MQDQPRRNCKIPSAHSQNVCFLIFFSTTDFLCRWAYDAIIHSHSQVFIIPCALTVKPPASLFCLVIEFYPTVYKTRNINQRLHHQPKSKNTQFSWPWTTVGSKFYCGVKQPFQLDCNVVFYIFITGMPLLIFRAELTSEELHEWYICLAFTHFLSFLYTHRHSAYIMTMHIHDLYSCYHIH